MQREEFILYLREIIRTILGFLLVVAALVLVVILITLW